MFSLTVAQYILRGVSPCSTHNNTFILDRQEEENTEREIPIMAEGSGSGTGRGRGTGRGTGREWETETETDTRTAREIVIDLFGERDPPPPVRYFDAYFGPPPPPPRPQDPGQERPPESSTTTEEEVPEWKKNTHFYFDGDMVPPFQYSSSIDYGSREWYKCRKKPGEDEPVFSTSTEHSLEDGFATRGDWWRGSYHY